MELLENNFCCSVLFFSKSTSIKYYARMEWSSVGTIGQKIICCCLRFFVFCWFFCTKSTSTGMERDCAGTIGQKSRHRSRSDDNQLCQVCNSQIQCFIPKSSSKYPFFHNFRKLCTICASCIDFPENYVFFCKICVGVQDLHLPIMILHWKCWNFTHSDREG